MPSAADYSVLIGGVCASRFVWPRLRENFSSLETLCFSAGGVIASYYLWQKIQQRLRVFCARRKTYINKGFRAKFKKNFVFLKDDNKNDAQHIRRLAEESIKLFIAKCGLKAYSFSSSTTCEQDTVDCHLTYCHQDLEIPYHCNAIEKDHVLYMMDVNYNYNMEQFLWNGRPILLYSFFPTSVGGFSQDCVFLINADKITSVNNNGKCYEHQAFNFQYDTFVVKGLLYSLLVTVEQYVSPLDRDRRIVCLTPTAWYPSLFNWLATRSQCNITKMSYSYCNRNYLLTAIMAENNEYVPYVSIGLVGHPEEVRITYDEFYKISCNQISVDSQYSKYDSMIKSLKLRGFLAEDRGKHLCSRFPEIGRMETKMECQKQRKDKKTEVQSNE